MGSGIKEITDTIIQEALGRLEFALVLELVLACACAEYKQIRDQWGPSISEERVLVRGL